MVGWGHAEIRGPEVRKPKEIRSPNELPFEQGLIVLH